MDAYDKAIEAGRIAAKPLWADVKRLKDEMTPIIDRQHVLWCRYFTDDVRSWSLDTFSEADRTEYEALAVQRIALRDKISAIHTLIKQIERAAEVKALKAHKSALRRRNPHLANLWR